MNIEIMDVAIMMNRQFSLILEYIKKTPTKNPIGYNNILGIIFRVIRYFKRLSFKRFLGGLHV